jgi:hypothetical protein
LREVRSARYLESRIPEFRPGEIITSMLGWCRYFVSDERAVRKVDGQVRPLSAYLGILGMPGLTAWAGLYAALRQAGDQSGRTGGLAGLAGGVLGATTGGGTIGQLAQEGIQFGAQGLMLKYSRTDESQADAVGAIILYKAGYNPQALADFFKTLESQNTGAPPQLLSDHPNPGNREQATEKEIRNRPPQNYAGDSVGFQKTRQHALGVKAFSAEEIAAGAKIGQWAGTFAERGIGSCCSVNVEQQVPATATSEHRCIVILATAAGMTVS